MENSIKERGMSFMKCPYCNENDISPFKKLTYENIKCNSCGKTVHFSKSKRIISVLVFVTAIFFNNILNAQRIYNLIVFFSLIIFLFIFIIIIPAEKDK